MHRLSTAKRTSGKTDHEMYVQTQHVVIPHARDVATVWTVVAVSVPLLPEVVPGIDANPMSFYGRSWGQFEA